MFEQESVFKRTEVEGEIISDRVYNLAIGVVLAWGFWVNYYMIKTIPVEAIQSVSPWLLIIGYIASCFAGIMIFTKSDNPTVSFLGYNLVVIPMGIIISPFVHAFDPQIVERAFLATGMVTTIMIILGTAYPAFFFKIAGALFWALLSVIVVEMFMAFVLGYSASFIDWIVVAIFCGYIGYDWARANSIPKTLDNAVDSAASLYIDIINLFIRILSIMGRKS